MSPMWNMILALLVYFVIAAGSYMLGRMDENRKWANIWFNHWKSLIDERVKNGEQ